ncbi:hypothetical protein V6N13_023625 [Hibiscus sabdariffa]
MQWKGLWHLFARHGEVKRAFIAKKLSRGGKRFGFVSFGMESDASRAMERLNGFSVYGYRLTVKLANHYKWRVSGKHYHDQINKGVDSLRQPRNNQTVRGMYQREVYKKKVVGHVIDEELWKLQRCLIGEMATVCSIQSIVKRLEQWGLNGIKVQRMGGKVFLLSFEDEDHVMLEDLEWSYLNEIFCKVEEWSMNLKRPLRATWIEIRGVPLHAWNDITLKKIAEIWGNFEAWGENVNRALNFEREWEESGRESSRKLPKIIGENDNKSVEEKEKLQVSDLGLNTRSWVDVVSAGIQDKSTCVGGPSQKVGQEYSTEMVRVGENDLGLSAKEGVGVLKDKEVETIRVELDRAEVNHHEWAKEGD